MRDGSINFKNILIIPVKPSHDMLQEDEKQVICSENVTYGNITSAKHAPWKKNSNDRR